MNVDSYKDGVLPFAAMVMLEVGNVGMATLGKAAMTSGLSNFTFVVYYNALGTFILFLYYIFQRYRSRGPPLTFSLLFKFFLLGLLGICLEQICAVTGIKYSSPTLAVAMGNLIPGFTFFLAVIFSLIGAIVIAFGFYTVMWGQAKEKVMVADNVHSLESSTQKTPLLQNT
ncbi:WAT1-related protein At5g40240-like [Fagus crenata]